MGAAARVDEIFQALAHPARRAVLEQLAAGPATVSELAAPHAMALPSFVAHLRVLEQNGLVTSEKQGRVRTYRLAPAPLQIAEHWITRQRAQWERRMDQMDAYLLKLKEKEG